MGKGALLHSQRAAARSARRQTVRGVFFKTEMSRDEGGGGQKSRARCWLIVDWSVNPLNLLHTANATTALLWEYDDDDVAIDAYRRHDMLSLAFLWIMLVGHQEGWQNVASLSPNQRVFKHICGITVVDNFHENRTAEFYISIGKKKLTTSPWE